jgi:hypothetical protein
LGSTLRRIAASSMAALTLKPCRGADRHLREEKIPMIRGPVLQPPREGLWKLVASRLAALESGLELVQESFECSGGGEVGSGYVAVADALLRDAAGAPVFLVVANEADVALAGRVLAALSFCERMGDTLGRALPEAGFVPGVAGRVLVVGQAAGLAPLDMLRRLAPRGMELCQLEPFRLGGVERCATRWLGGSAAAQTAGLPEFALPEALQPLWGEVERFVRRLDPVLVIDGDRFQRRLSWHGRMLGRIALADGALVAIAPSGAVVSLDSVAQVRRWCDQLFRSYLAVVAAAAPGLSAAASAAGGRPAEPGGLRASLAGARVSAEEYAALGRSRRGEEVDPPATGEADADASRWLRQVSEGAGASQLAPPD